ncbi:tetrahydromethanopterin-linked C1 transfer pathway [Rubripirellula amarantea]|nr:tetrahydromethanopterin-linked C1 transfer pathway [Rubripirellula amarantea]
MKTLEDTGHCDTARVVGIDIGGANLKVSDLLGNAASQFFPMWSDSDRLCDALADMLVPFEFSSLAVTMTGELADCFFDRREGVSKIVDSAVAASKRFNADVCFYTVEGEFVGCSAAKQNPDAVAASNWHASAKCIAEEYFGNDIASSHAASSGAVDDAMVVDVGSTTTDIVPIKAGKVATASCTDFDRLVEGSLVYLGCGRTPVCSLVSSLRFRGRNVRVMNEVFATMDDVMLILGKNSEDAQDCQSADQRPRTIEMAANRMARMIGLDHRRVDISLARDLSAQVMTAAQHEVQLAFDGIDNGGTIVMIGHGGELLCVPADRDVLRLDQIFNAEVSRCFPAYAVGVLLANTIGSRA